MIPPPCAPPAASSCRVWVPFATRPRACARPGWATRSSNVSAPASPSWVSVSGCSCCSTSSGEGGRWPGLSVFAGSVERLETPLKVPHIGWNELQWRAPGAAMGDGLGDGTAVYFVHSYAARPADDSVIAAVTDYGGDHVAAVAQDNVWAVQFHPEKSSAAGLRLLANFTAFACEGRTPL